MLKKLFSIFLIPFLFCSCSKNNVEEISFSSWGSITETKILENAIKNFEIKNPNIKVNFIHIPQNYFQKLHLLFVSSQAPDVIFINNLYLPVYANKLENLEDLINKDEFYKQSTDALTVEGKLLGIPRDISNMVFYVNKNLVKTNINPYWSFEDYTKFLDKLKGETFYPISFERDIYWAAPYILTLGYDSGINFYKQLEGTYAPLPAQIGSSTQTQMFLDGKIALYLSGRWMYPKISQNAKFDFEVVPFAGIGPADASGWAISKDSKHKSSAKKFIKYLASKEAIDYFTQTGLIVPARKDSSKILDNQKEQAFIIAIKRSKTQNIDKNYKRNRDRINKELFN